MIAKIMKSKADIMPTLNYLFKKIEDEKGVLLSSNMISIPNTAMELYEEFSELICSRETIRSVDKNVKHISISMADQEHLTDDRFTEIANRYLDDMGYSNSPNIVFRHYDTSNEHIHIIVSQVDYDLERVVDSNERRRSQEVSRAIEKEYSLKLTSYNQGPKITLEEINSNKYLLANALVSLTEGQIQALESDFQVIQNVSLREVNAFYQNLLGKHFPNFLKAVAKNSNVSNLNKNELVDLIADLYVQSKDYKDFLENLKRNEVYTRLVYKDGRPELVYGFKGQYYNERSFAKKYCFIHLQTYGVSDKPYVSESDQRRFLKSEIQAAVKSSHDYNYLTSLLAHKGIKVEEHKRNDEIIGLRFYSIYPSNPIVFKASDIDRSLSYKSIVDQISQNNTNQRTEVPEMQAHFWTGENIPFNEKGVDLQMFSMAGLFSNDKDLDSLRKKKKKKKNQRNL